MKPKHKRLYSLCLSIIGAIIGVTIILYSLRDKVLFFYTPTQALEHKNVPIRVGGLVTTHVNNNMFMLSDKNTDLPVHYTGVLPPLFAKDQYAIVHGSLQKTVLYATEVLAKHNEYYRPL